MLFVMKQGPKRIDEFLRNTKEGDGKRGLNIRMQFILRIQYKEAVHHKV